MYKWWLKIKFMFKILTFKPQCNIICPSHTVDSQHKTYVAKMWKLQVVGRENSLPKL